MSFGNTNKGIVFKKSKTGKQLLLIHRKTMEPYLDDIPENENGWQAFEINEVHNKKGSKSHDITPLIPDGFLARRTKVDGPTEFK